MSFLIKSALVVFSIVVSFFSYVLGSQEIITSYLKSMSNAKGISVEMHNVISVQEASLEIHEVIRMTSSKPNYIRAEYRAEAITGSQAKKLGLHWILLSDGDGLFLISGSGRYYQKLKAPRDFWQIFSPTAWKRAPDLHYVVARWFAPFALMHPDDPGGFFHDARLEGKVEVDGEMLYKFFLSENIELIDGRATPGIRCSETLPAGQIRFYLKKEGDVLIFKRFSLIYREKESRLFESLEWDFEKPPSDHFQLPEGLMQVDSILEMVDQTDKK